MTDNLKIWEAVREVPANAKKEIRGGRLKGMTDINPMWRLKTLTEQFGLPGIGWKYEIVNKDLREGANGEVAAFVDVNLYIKQDGEWSEAIPGTGGSMFITNEKSGKHTSDECFKMALTDAISVSCKALGFGADVYWDKDKTKYTTPTSPPETKTTTPPPPETQGYYTNPDALTCTDCQKAITKGASALSVKKFKRALCPDCQTKEGAKNNA